MIIDLITIYLDSISNQTRGQSDCWQIYQIIFILKMKKNQKKGLRPSQMQNDSSSASLPQDSHSGDSSDELYDKFKLRKDMPQSSNNGQQRLVQHQSPFKDFVFSDQNQQQKEMRISRGGENHKAEETPVRNQPGLDLNTQKQSFVSFEDRRMQEDYRRKLQANPRNFSGINMVQELQINTNEINPNHSTQQQIQLQQVSPKAGTALINHRQMQSSVNQMPFVSEYDEANSDHNDVQNADEQLFQEGTPSNNLDSQIAQQENQASRESQETAPEQRLINQEHQNWLNEQIITQDQINVANPSFNQIHSQEKEIPNQQNSATYSQDSNHFLRQRQQRIIDQQHQRSDQNVLTQNSTQHNPPSIFEDNPNPHYVNSNSTRFECARESNQQQQMNLQIVSSSAGSVLTMQEINNMNHQQNHQNFRNFIQGNSSSKIFQHKQMGVPSKASRQPMTNNQLTAADQGIHGLDVHTPLFTVSQPQTLSNSNNQSMQQRRVSLERQASELNKGFIIDTNKQLSEERVKQLSIRGNEFPGAWLTSNSIRDTVLKHGQFDGQNYQLGHTLSTHIPETIYIDFHLSNQFALQRTQTIRMSHSFFCGREKKLKQSRIDKKQAYNILKGWFSQLMEIQKKGIFVPGSITKIMLVDASENDGSDDPPVLMRQQRVDLFIASLFETVNSTCDFWKQVIVNKQLHSQIKRMNLVLKIQIQQFVASDSDTQQVYRVHWKRENGFKCYRFTNSKPMNSYASINLQVLSELFEQRLEGLNEAKIDSYIQKIRYRTLETQIASYRNLLTSLNLQDESVNLDFIRPTSSSFDNNSVYSNIRPLETNSDRAQKSDRLMVLPFDLSEFDDQIQMAQKQHVIMQYILDSRKNAGAPTADEFQPQNMRRFGQFLVDLSDNNEASNSELDRVHMNAKKNFYDPVIKEKIRLTQQQLFDFPEERLVLHTCYKACHKAKALVELQLQKTINNVSYKFQVTKIVCDFVWQQHGERAVLLQIDQYQYEQVKAQQMTPQRQRKRFISVQPSRNHIQEQISLPRLQQQQDMNAPLPPLNRSPVNFQPCLTNIFTEMDGPGIALESAPAGLTNQPSAPLQRQTPSLSRMAHQQSPMRFPTQPQQQQQAQQFNFPPSNSGAKLIKSQSLPRMPHPAQYPGGQPQAAFIPSSQSLPSLQLQQAQHVDGGYPPAQMQAGTTQPPPQVHHQQQPQLQPLQLQPQQSEYKNNMSLRTPIMGARGAPPSNASTNDLMAQAAAELAVDPVRDLSPAPVPKDQIDTLIKSLEVRQTFQSKLIDLYKEFSEELTAFNRPSKHGMKQQPQYNELSSQIKAGQMPTSGNQVSNDIMVHPGTQAPPQIQPDNHQQQQQQQLETLQHTLQHTEGGSQGPPEQAPAGEDDYIVFINQERTAKEQQEIDLFVVEDQKKGNTVYGTGAEDHSVFADVSQREQVEGSPRMIFNNRPKSSYGPGNNKSERSSVKDGPNQHNKDLEIASSTGTAIFDIDKNRGFKLTQNNKQLHSDLIIEGHHRKQKSSTSSIPHGVLQLLNNSQNEQRDYVSGRPPKSNSKQQSPRQQMEQSSTFMPQTAITPPPGYPIQMKSKLSPFTFEIANLNNTRFSRASLKDGSAAGNQALLSQQVDNMEQIDPIFMHDSKDKSKDSTINQMEKKTNSIKKFRNSTMTEVRIEVQGDEEYDDAEDKLQVADEDLIERREEMEESKDVVQEMSKLDEFDSVRNRTKQEIRYDLVNRQKVKKSSSMDLDVRASKTDPNVQQASASSNKLPPTSSNNIRSKINSMIMNMSQSSSSFSQSYGKQNKESSNQEKQDEAPNAAAKNDDQQDLQQDQLRKVQTKLEQKIDQIQEQLIQSIENLQTQFQRASTQTFRNEQDKNKAMILQAQELIKDMKMQFSSNQRELNDGQKHDEQQMNKSWLTLQYSESQQLDDFKNQLLESMQDVVRQVITDMHYARTVENQTFNDRMLTGTMMIPMSTEKPVQLGRKIKKINKVSQLMQKDPSSSDSGGINDRRGSIPIQHRIQGNFSNRLNLKKSMNNSNLAINEAVKFNISNSSSSKRNEEDKGTLQYSESQIPKNTSMNKDTVVTSPVKSRSDSLQRHDKELKRLSDDEVKLSVKEEFQLIENKNLDRKGKNYTKLNFDTFSTSNKAYKNISKEQIKAQTERERDSQPFNGKLISKTQKSLNDDLSSSYYQFPIDDKTSLKITSYRNGNTDGNHHRRRPSSIYSDSASSDSNEALESSQRSNAKKKITIRHIRSVSNKGISHKSKSIYQTSCIEEKSERSSKTHSQLGGELSHSTNSKNNAQREIEVKKVDKTDLTTSQSQESINMQTSKKTKKRRQSNSKSNNSKQNLAVATDSNNTTLKSLSSIPRMRTMKENYSSHKSTNKSKSNSNKDMSLTSHKKLDQYPDNKSFEKSREDLNMTKRSGDHIIRTHTPESYLSINNQNPITHQKVINSHRQTDKNINSVMISSSSNNISQMSKDKTFVVKAKFDMSPHPRITNSTTHLYTDVDKKIIQVPFNIPDEPSDSFELRLSKKHLTFKSDIEMDTFHHDKSRLIQVEVPNQSSGQSTPSEQPKKFIIHKYKFGNKSSTSNCSNSNRQKSPVVAPRIDDQQSTNTKQGNLPIESINDEFQSSIDFKLTDTVGGTYSSQYQHEEELTRRQMSQITTYNVLHSNRQTFGNNNQSPSGRHYSLPKVEGINKNGERRNSLPKVESINRNELQCLQSLTRRSDHKLKLMQPFKHQKDTKKYNFQTSKFKQKQLQKFMNRSPSYSARTNCQESEVTTSARKLIKRTSTMGFQNCEEKNRANSPKVDSNHHQLNAMQNLEEGSNFSSQDSDIPTAQHNKNDGSQRMYQVTLEDSSNNQINSYGDAESRLTKDQIRHYRTLFREVVDNDSESDEDAIHKDDIPTKKAMIDNKDIVENRFANYKFKELSDEQAVESQPQQQKTQKHGIEDNIILENAGLMSISPFDIACQPPLKPFDMPLQKVVRIPPQFLQNTMKRVSINTEHEVVIDNKAEFIDPGMTMKSKSDLNFTSKLEEYRKSSTMQQNQLNDNPFAGKRSSNLYEAKYSSTNTQDYTFKTKSQRNEGSMKTELL